MSNVTADQYWAHQDPQVRALRTMHDPELSTKAHELADAGELIDVPIMVWQWDPFLVMSLRAMQNLTWVPSANQEPLNLAGDALMFGFAGRHYDPATPPPGSIKVSVDSIDYPAFDPPAPPTPAPDARLVGSWTGVGQRYYCLPAGLPLPKGFPTTQDGVNYKKVVIPGLMAPFHGWEVAG